MYFRIQMPSFTLALPTLSSLFGANLLSSGGLEPGSDSASLPWLPHHHEWQAPTDSDLRGPCPGLNTLANHNFIQRDGRNITMRGVLDAIDEVFNMDPEVLTVAAHVAILSSAAVDTFTLQDIRLHNAIEHDASLSRSDFLVGPNNWKFNETIFQTLANANPGVNYYNATSAGEVQRLRLIEDEAANPQIINTVKEFGLRTTESALYLTSLGDPTTGVAKKEIVQTFFREERLPIKQGWRKPKTRITNALMGTLEAVIGAASQWTPGPGSPSIAIVTGPNTTVVF